MTLEKAHYRAFEDILGSENISDDPVILYPYSWRSGLYAGAAKFTPRFEAAVLPQSTEEVQAVVKLCNKFKLKFKASSTGWGPYNDAAGPGVIKIDLRRMNRILEINEKNMFAVVEPYVVGAQLQAELMKRGLNCNQCGAGTNCSALPIAAHQGIGHLSQSASYGERNQLALEWVTPEGDVVRMGSLGSSGEWFCGDGPGPSLRGLVRGNVVPLGGLGVYTKAATKIYHWAGPPTFPIEGVSPHYTPAYIPRHFFIGIYSFPSLDRLDEAQRLVGESEIALELMGFNAAMASANMATSNEEDVRLFKEFSQYVQGPTFMIVIAGNSERDFQYKTAVLEKIIAEAGGKAVPKLLDDPKVAGGCLWRWVRSTASIREVFRASGCFGGEVGGTDSFRLMAEYIFK
ncbi:MAG TPA: FAD-binding oxidoreductase, partial [Dehalococcoidales bacterium]|nr:FAD-binding oxidoreductase [Dehalococcoidales bacterium]